MDAFVALTQEFAVTGVGGDTGNSPPGPLSIAKERGSKMQGR